MAFCKKCGAYIPDGLTACLACGYDELAEQAAAAAKKETRTRKDLGEDVREVIERHRKIQQEKIHQWAENEKERRQKQNENRQWAQEEYARRQAEREAQTQQQRQEPGTGTEERGFHEERSDTKSGNYGLAALSYLSVFFALPFFLTPEDEYAKYHAKQGFRLFVFSALADIVAGFIPFGWILTVFRIYCIYKGISNALQGKKEPLPYIGTFKFTR